MSNILLTVEAAAERLGCAPETVRRAIRAGRLACYRLGGCIRIAPEHLSAFLESHLCPVRDQTAPASSSTADSTTSPGGTDRHVGAYQQARRTQSALDRALRTSKPSLNIVLPS